MEIHRNLQHCTVLHIRLSLGNFYNNLNKAGKNITLIKMTKTEICFAYRRKRNRFGTVFTDEFCVAGSGHSGSAVIETVNSFDFCTSFLFSLF
jgi:hypothetical protein